MKYSAQLLDYFYHCDHAGRLDSTMPSVCYAQVGNSENQVLALYIDYQNQILQARFQAAGSVALIAGGEFICRWLEKKTWSDLQKLTPEFILAELSLSKLHIYIANLILIALKKLAILVPSPP